MRIHIQRSILRLIKQVWVRNLTTRTRFCVTIFIAVSSAEESTFRLITRFLEGTFGQILAIGGTKLF